MRCGNCSQTWVYGEHLCANEAYPLKLSQLKGVTLRQDTTDHTRHRAEGDKCREMADINGVHEGGETATLNYGARPGRARPGSILGIWEAQTALTSLGKWGREEKEERKPLFS